MANPPFVVSPGTGGYDYRDSGLAGDAVCEQLVRRLPAVLAEQGSAQLLANWIIPADRPWADRLADWLAGRACDAWVWQREIAEPAEYVALWLRDAGERPGTPEWAAEVRRLAGLVRRVRRSPPSGWASITMWRTDAADPVVVLEDVPQAVEQPAGAHLPGWIARQRWLAGNSDAGLMDAVLSPAPGLVLERSDLLGPTAGRPPPLGLRQSYGMRWEVETDEAVAALVAGCDGSAPLHRPVSVLAAALGHPPAEIADALLPVVRDLIGRGFLLPEGHRMRAVVARVTRASVEVDGAIVGSIGVGLLALVGVTHTDTEREAAALARKIAGLRILRDELSVLDLADAGILAISQFTLYGDARKGPASDLDRRGARSRRRAADRRLRRRPAEPGRDRGNRRFRSRHAGRTPE